MDNPSRKAWAGYAFEQVCKDHLSQIKRQIGISAVLSEYSSWYSHQKHTIQNQEEDIPRGAQIDLVIDRRDRVINLCEMKFCYGEYEITNDYDKVLRNKIERFREETKTKKALHLTMITTYGVKQGKYSGLIQSQVTMDDLFQ